MKWKIHDPNRPVPAVIDPGTASTQDTPGRPPSDATVLFDGKDLSHSADKDGKAAKWKVEKGYMEVVARPATFPRTIPSKIASSTWSSPSLHRRGGKPGASQ